MSCMDRDTLCYGMLYLQVCPIPLTERRPALLLLPVLLAVGTGCRPGGRTRRLLALGGWWQLGPGPRCRREIAGAS